MKHILVCILFFLYAGGCMTLTAPEEIVISRDIYGVPHITAESDEGAFFGMGYVQAQDHLEQMMKNFAQAAGRLSSIEGKKGYNSDVIVNVLGIPEIAQEKYTRLSVESRSAIEAFCDGVNRYIKEHEESLPQWIDKVSPEEVVALSKYFMLSRPISRLKKDELRYVKGKSLITGDFTEDLSNEWVISPQKSAHGTVMIQADPHLPWEGPEQFYEVHIKGKTINVAGAAPFGLPVVILGFNEHIAWAMTANSPDTADVYEERIKKEGDTYWYEYDSVWREIEEKRVTLTIKGEDDKEVVFYYTHHGPVIAFDQATDTAYTAKLSTLHEVGMIDQILLMNRASTLSEFKDALSLQQVVRWNIVYGDVDGNIYYVYNARVGIRDETYNWNQPVPGWTSETEWKGIYPFEKLPQCENPEEGFIQNCNVAPWFINTTSTKKEYPDYLVPDSPMNNRGRRATQLLSQDTLFTVEDMMSFSLDTYSLAAEEGIASLLQVDTSSLDDTTREAFTLLRTWDCTVEKESREPLLFITWLTLKDKRTDIEALREAVDYLEETYGRYDVMWGDVHVIKRGDTIYPLSGSHILQTLFMTGGDIHQHKEYCDHGSSYVLLVELGDRVRAWSVRPLGQSEDCNSPHFADMTELYSRKQYKAFFFTEKDIAAHLESHIILEY
jgi:acyl-homoserine lactone acylase PvdQ